MISGGPTGFLASRSRARPGGLEKGYTEQVFVNYMDNLKRPECVSRWQWEHVLAHIHAGDQPPLARALLTTARRAAATGNSRLAVIDAATAAEVALTTGLTDRLSAITSPQGTRARIDRTRMLGPRLNLARQLGMTLPGRINPDLVERRNAVVHGGTRVTDTEAQAAIKAAAELVDEYEPLPNHCQEPSPRNDSAKVNRASRGGNGSGLPDEPPF